MNRPIDPLLVFAAAALAAAILAGCSASVTTFSADISDPPASENARDICAAEVNARSTTHSIGIGSVARTTRERMRACIDRYNVDPVD